MTPGFFTPNGSARFAARHPALAAQAFFRNIPAGAVSSLGLGTYLGKPDETTSARYVDAILAALRGGINTFDTAINYRYTRSEQDLGEALRRAFNENLAARDELLIATKAGFLTIRSCWRSTARRRQTRPAAHPRYRRSIPAGK